MGAQHRVGTDLSPVASCDASQGKFWLEGEVPTAASLSPHIRSHNKFMAEMGLEPNPLQALGLCFYPHFPSRQLTLVPTLVKGVDEMGETPRSWNVETGLGKGEAF